MSEEMTLDDWSPMESKIAVKMLVAFKQLKREQPKKYSPDVGWMLYLYGVAKQVEDEFKVNEVRETPELKPLFDWIPMFPSTGVFTYYAKVNGSEYTIMEQKQGHYNCFVDTFRIPIDSSIEDCKQACEDHYNGKLDGQKD